MQDFELILPTDFDESVWEDKGYFVGAFLIVEGTKYPISFYDPTRLNQDVASEVGSGGIFFEQNLVVVSRVGRESFLVAARWLVRTGEWKRLSATVPAGGYGDT